MRWGHEKILIPCYHHMFYRFDFKKMTHLMLIKQNTRRFFSIGMLSGHVMCHKELWKRKINFKKQFRRCQKHESVLHPDSWGPKISPVALFLTSSDRPEASYPKDSRALASQHSLPPPSRGWADGHQLISCGTQRSHFMLWLFSKICAPKSSMARQLAPSKLPNGKDNSRNLLGVLNFPTRP